jgi:hypothetical protein
LRSFGGLSPEGTPELLATPDFHPAFFFLSFNVDRLLNWWEEVGRSGEKWPAFPRSPHV